ncbi:hypothetical protein SBOR_2482 [Sclerotinia borealis F-4128]|uniref:Uncharacterized protein n=1 Tax=Sclerotinia borealis (strain F-4128) TaxID=1432307 RepID=W9CR96_SCLBF|nr:hypothetical protein SBOR_2482 [Sclerotinia borealis F-4128]
MPSQKRSQSPKLGEHHIDTESTSEHPFKKQNRSESPTQKAVFQIPSPSVSEMRWKSISPPRQNAFEAPSNAPRRAALDIPSLRFLRPPNRSLPPYRSSSDRPPQPPPLSLRPANREASDENEDRIILPDPPCPPTPQLANTSLPPPGNAPFSNEQTLFRSIRPKMKITFKSEGNQASTFKPPSSDDESIDSESITERKIRNHKRCRNCRDKTQPNYGVKSIAVEQIKEKHPMSGGIGSRSKDPMIAGPLTREILHFQKASDHIITTTIEFTDAPGEDNLHAFLDRAEEDAREAGMPENLEPTKLIVTWDNGAQLNAVRSGMDNLDKMSSVTLIQNSKSWRGAIRQMRQKLWWSNQNWTIWWMEKRADDDDEERGLFYDTSASRPAHWCMPSVWRASTTLENELVSGKNQTDVDYKQFVNISVDYTIKPVVDYPTYEM